RARAALHTVALHAALPLCLGWAAWRRYLQPPWRIRSKTKPEDGWILATLALIGVTGFTTEAARIALVDRPAFEVWSCVALPLSRDRKSTRLNSSHVKTAYA